MRKALCILVCGTLCLSLPLSFSSAQTVYSFKVFSNATDWFKVMLYEMGGSNPIIGSSMELISTQLPIHEFSLDSDFFPNGGEISYSRVPFGPTSAQVNFQARIIDQLYLACMKGSYGTLTIQIWDSAAINLLQQYNNNLTGAWCFSSWVWYPTVAVGEEPPSVPASNSLQQNYPNPFNPATTISYSVESPVQVKIMIYDSLGRLVRTLVDQPTGPGEHQVIWNGDNNIGAPVAAGTYYYQLVAGERAEAKKMILLK